jgi:hypothetical protein
MGRMGDEGRGLSGGWRVRSLIEQASVTGDADLPVAGGAVGEGTE